MRRYFREVWDRLLGQSRRSGAHKPRHNRRLQVEGLEDRALMAVVTGGLQGIVRSQDGPLAGIPVHVSGTSGSGTHVNVTVTTNASGSYKVLNILAGSYTVSAGPVSAFVGWSGNTATGVVVSGGGTTTRNFVFSSLHLAPTGLSMRQFLNTAASINFTLQTGSGTTLANSRSDQAPVVGTAIAPVDVLKNSANTVIDLAGNFTDADMTNSRIRFNTSAGPINVDLFDAQAPRTVANFFNYIQSHRYDHSFFHRLATGFVLQGGGFTFSANPSTITAITTDAPVQNEFSATRSNTIGTLAMAKLPGDPNSATDQFYFNLANNAGTTPNGLDFQNGGFTVFGKIVGTADQQVINALAATTTKNESGFNSALDQLPLKNYTGTHFPSDTTASNYEMINSVSVVSRNEFLTYSVVSNTNQALVTATIVNNRLTLHYATGATGSAVITVKATDKIGANVQTSFTVTVT